MSPVAGHPNSIFEKQLRFMEGDGLIQKSWVLDPTLSEGDISESCYTPQAGSTKASITLEPKGIHRVNSAYYRVPTCQMGPGRAVC